MAKKYNQKIDVIIPAYNVPDNILFRCLSSIACQDIIDDIEVTIIDDASTEQNYKEIANYFKKFINVKVLRCETNGGPGVARQLGINNTFNGYLTFIDADDTFNGSFALKALREGVEVNPCFQMCVGIFDEIHTEIDGVYGTAIIPHEQDMVWMFGKIYKRSFIEKYGIKFHPTSRANEDNGFNQLCKMCMNDQEQINFIPAHVYYWHENENSITRINDCQYSYGSSDRDSFYGYVENMIYAIKEAKKRNPYNGNITMQAVNVMVNLYEYYIECASRAPEHAEGNFKQCQRYYNEIYKSLEEDISNEILAQHYNEIMRSAYFGDKLNGIIPNIGIYEFLNQLKLEVE